MADEDLKDLSAFHTSVSVALGTAFQHLADSLFVQLANFILLRRDSYLEYVKPGLKPDTWNKLRNAKKDNKQSGFSSSQSQQPWRQFSGRGRGKSRGRGGSSSPYFSKSAR